MKENNIEKLQERLETLHVTQDARLACNADDLDIREEIAEVEEEIKELRDDTNVDKENNIKNEQSSMEETVKNIEKMIKSYKEADKCGLSNNDFKNEIKALEHILQDYKRVLKENELLRKDRESWKKYCEEIEEERIEMSNKNCKLEFEVEKLQKENEELKIAGIPVRNKRNGKIGMVLRQWKSGSIAVLESINPRVINTHDSWNTLEIVTDEVKQTQTKCETIPVSFVKGKIEELNIAILECEYLDDDDEEYKKAVEKDKFILKKQRDILEELIEERK